MAKKIYWQHIIGMNATIEPKADVKHDVTIDLCDLSIAISEEEQNASA